MVEFNPLCIPALVALAAKVGLLSCVRFSVLSGPDARLFVYLMYALAAQNTAEISLFYYSGPVEGTIALTAGFAYFAASIAAIALLAHLAASVALGDGRPWRRVLHWIYGSAALLQVLLLGTPWLVVGFEAHGFSFTRVPGPLYPLFSLFSLACLGMALGSLGYTSLRPHPSIRRRKSRLFLVAVAPMALLAVVVVSLQWLGINVVSTPVFLSVGVTFFLFVVAYAVFDFRLFSLSFPARWRLENLRQSSFHRGMQDLVAEIDSLASANDAVARLATVARCPVAIVGPGARIASANGGHLLDVPAAQLSTFEAITVADDPGAAGTLEAARMEALGAAAVVPFRSRTSSDRRWLLFGRSSEADTLDFDAVEDVCQRIGERFLDEAGSERGDALDRVDARLQDIAARLAAIEAGTAGASSTGDIEEPVSVSPVNYEEDSMQQAFASLKAGQTLAGLMAETEARLLREALVRTGGNKAKAARLLGLRANTLHYKLSRYEIGHDKSSTGVQAPVKRRQEGQE